jgi:hypothetical protein
MKTVITTIITALILLLGNTTVNGSAIESELITLAVSDSDKEQLFSKFERSLLYGFESEHSSVIESVLFNVLEIKTVYPEFESKAVESALLKVAREGEKHVVRYKAYLTLYYYRNQDKFGSNYGILSLFETRSPNDLYLFLDLFIADRLRGGQLTNR